MSSIIACCSDPFILIVVTEVGSIIREYFISSSRGTSDFRSLASPVEARSGNSVNGESKISEEAGYHV